jgi:pimeloyl-ACP methyl ester carboxylesterase
MARWTLNRRARIEGVEIAYDVVGEGPPVVLVHGFPSNSFIWRDVVPVLAETHRVHVYDLPGQGASERRPGMDVSDALQTRVLCGLLNYWRLDRPAAFFHDVGNAYGMAAYHFEGRRFERIALISAALMNPCVSAATQHAQAHLEAYRTMPVELYELIAAARIRSTTYRPMTDEILEAYLAPWRGRLGQSLWYNRVSYLDEGSTARIEARLGPVEVPVRIIWGTEDSWIPVSQATRLQQLISNAELCLIPDGGHFLMEDAPGEVARLLREFLNQPGPVADKPAVKETVHA